MPLPILWTFFYCTEDGCLYLKVGDVDVKKAYGAILAVRRFGNKNTAVKVSPTAIHVTVLYLPATCLISHSLDFCLCMKYYVLWPDS